MTRQTVGMWETEVHLAQGSMRVEEPSHAHGGHLHRQSIMRNPGLWWRPDCHSRWPIMCPEHMRASPSQEHPSAAGQVEQKLVEVISLEGPRGLRPEGMLKQGRRHYWWWWHRWHVGGSLDLCKQPAWRFAPFVIFLTRTRSSWSSVARVAVMGEGSVHTWGNTSISGLTFRASAPETWDPTLPPIGQWKTLRKRKSLPHIWLQTWYHWTSHQ